MKLGLVLLISLWSIPEDAANTYAWKVRKVLDGDTISFRVRFLPKPLPPRLSVRLYGVDTPEKSWRGKCPEEKALGKKATEFTKLAIKQAKQIRVELLGWDKYGGRVLGRVLLDGKDLGTELVAAGLARRYEGKKKQSWCGGKRDETGTKGTDS